MPTSLAPLEERGAAGCYLHFVQRLRERYGLNLSPAEYLALSECIAQQLAQRRLKVAPSGAPGRVKFHYPVQVCQPLLVFDLRDGLLITALDDEPPPPEYEEAPPERKPRKRRRPKSSRKRRDWTRYG